MKNENIDFETALKELEAITEQLENGDLSLDRSIELFEKGIELSKICSNKLKTAKQKIITLEQAENEG